MSDDGTDKNVYFYNGSQVIQLTNNNIDNYSDSYFPKLSGNYIVWAASDGTDNEIYLADTREFASLNQAPVYRFYNSETQKHFYTATPSERDYLLQSLPQYQEDGIAFFASQNPQPNLLPVYRFFNSVTQDHFFTILITHLT